MKTGMEWIATIKDEGIRAEMLSNIDGIPWIGEGIDIKYSSLSNALITSFYWQNSPQGYLFWANIWDRILKNLKRRQVQAKLY